MQEKESMMCFSVSKKIPPSCETVFLNPDVGGSLEGRDGDAEVGYRAGETGTC